MRSLQRKRLAIWIVLLLVVASGSFAFGHFIDEIVNPGPIQSSQSRTATYTIGLDTNGTIWAKNLNGQVAYSGSDAATVIQNAINSLSDLNGGRILITSGTYLIKQTLRVYRYVWLIGQSMEGSQLVQGLNDSLIQIRESPGSSEHIGFVEIKDLTFFGNTRLFKSGTAIEDANLSDVTIEHNFIDSFPQDAIRIDGGYYVRIQNNWIESNRGNGVALYVPSNYVENNIIYNNGGDGIYVHANNQDISGNRITLNGENGIELVSYGKWSRIYGNEFEANGQATIYKYMQIKQNSVDQTAIVGNAFAANENLSYVIWFWSPEDTVVTGNVFQDSGKFGWIYTNGSETGFTIAHNSGFTTENGGSASIRNGTFVIVYHGLAGLPTSILVTPESTGYGTYSVGAVNKSSFTITVAVPGNYTFSWYAIFQP